MKPKVVHGFRRAQEVLTYLLDLCAPLNMSPYPSAENMHQLPCFIRKAVDGFSSIKCSMDGAPFYAC